MTEDEAATYERLASDLRSARIAGTRLERERGATLDAASGLAIQAQGRALCTSAGERVAGRKVGLTSTNAQQTWSVTEPVSGYLIDSTVLPCAEEFDCRHLVTPRVEVEVAFILARPLEGADLGVSDVLAATRALAPALEIVDSRWDSGAPGVGALLADNVSTAAALVGHEVDPATVDLAHVHVAATIGSDAVTGDAGNVLGNPARAVAWLCADLSRRGERLEAGDVILSGAIGDPKPVRGGDVVRADYGDLGRLRTTFTG